MKTMETKRNFYDFKELIDIFDGKVSKSYLYILAKKGKFKTVRIGNKILISADEVLKLTQEGVR